MKTKFEDLIESIRIDLNASIRGGGYEWVFDAREQAYSGVGLVVHSATFGLARALRDSAHD